MKELENVELNTTLSYKDRVVKLFLDPAGAGDKTPNRNIVCEDLSGNIIWQVDDISPQNNCAFVEIKSLDEVKFRAYNWCGYLCEINLSDGKVMSSLFTK